MTDRGHELRLPQEQQVDDEDFRDDFLPPDDDIPEVRIREPRQSREAQADTEFDDDDSMLDQTTRNWDPRDIEPKDDKTPDGGDDAIDDQLLERARAVGFTDEDAKAFGSKAALEGALVAQDRVLARRGISATGAPNTGQPNTGQPPAPTGENAPPANGQQPSPSDGQFEYKFEGLDAYDEDLTGALGNFGKHTATNFKTLNGRLDTLVATLQEEAADMWFEKTNEAELFGGGPGATLHEGTPQWNNRMKLFTAAGNLMRGIAGNNGRVPPMRVLLDRAYAMEFAKQHQESYHRDLRGRFENRSRQETARPLANKPRDTRSKRQKALDRQLAFIKENNIEM